MTFMMAGLYFVQLASAWVDEIRDAIALDGVKPDRPITDWAQDYCHYVISAVRKRHDVDPLHPVFKDDDLQVKLANWTDVDLAMFYLAKALGFSEGTREDWYERGCGEVWTDNPRSRFLHHTLEMMVELRAVEKNEKDQYKWNF